MSTTRDGYKDAVSGFFDARSGYRRSALHARMAERFIRFAAPRSGERVLDIATGTGFVAIPAARLVGRRGHVTGIDLSAGMLERAAEAVAASGLDNIDLAQADAEALAYPAGSFDLMTCCNALPYMSDVPRALRQWRTLLRPGGRLAFNCWSEHSHATGRLLRELAARHGIAVAMIGEDTGKPERCRTMLAAAGYTRQDVIVEPTANYLSVDTLADVFESALRSPLFGIAAENLARVEALRGAYMAAAQSPSVRESLEAEAGAYFVLAHA